MNPSMHAALQPSISANMHLCIIAIRIRSCSRFPRPALFAIHTASESTFPLCSSSTSPHFRCQLSRHRCDWASLSCCRVASPCISASQPLGIRMHCHAYICAPLHPLVSVHLHVCICAFRRFCIYASLRLGPAASQHLCVYASCRPCTSASLFFCLYLCLRLHISASSCHGCSASRDLCVLAS